MVAKSRSSQPWLRWGGIAAIGAGLLGISFEVLGFLSHGPTGSDRKNPVFGLLNADYQRLLIVPGVLTVWALVVLYKHQETHLGRLGRPGFLLLMAAYALALIAQLLDYVIFPYPHSLFGLGFFIVVFFTIPLLLVGWLLYGVASVRDSLTPSWCRYIPFVLCAAILFVIVDLAMAILGIPVPFSLHSGLCSAIVAGIAWVAYGYALIGAWRNTTRQAA